MVHIKKQLRLLNVAFAAMLFLLAVMTGAAVHGLMTLREASELSRHTNEVLEEIFAVSRAYEAADQQGRFAVTGESDAELRTVLRRQAIEAVDALKLKVGDNPVQAENAEHLKAAVTERFQAQDAQINSVKRDNGTLSFDTTTTIRNVTAAARTENAVLRLRETEIELLNARTDRRTLTQYRITAGAMFVIFLLAAAASALFVIARRGMLRRIAIAESMKAAPVGIPNDKVEAWIRQLEEAEQQRKLVTYAL